MKKLYSPENESELAVIRSILDGCKICYFVHNDHFGTLKVGPRIELFNAKTIFVSEQQFLGAKEILDDFLNNIKDKSGDTQLSYSIADKIRMIIEVVVFQWFLPGKKWNKKEG